MKPYNKSLFLTLAFLSFAVASQSNPKASNMVKELEALSGTSVKVAKGTDSDSKRISLHNPVISLHISGGRDPKYSAENYAKMLRLMFKDKKRTQYPSEVYVRYEETGLDRSTLVSVFIDGKPYDKNGGKLESLDHIFSPVQLANHISLLTEFYAKKYDFTILSEGSSWKARNISLRQSAISLHISGGKSSKYTAKEYATMLRSMFNDKTRTTYPSEIFVRYEESNKERQSGVLVFINGKVYDKNGGTYEFGDGIFTPEQLVKYIEKISKNYHEEGKDDRYLNQLLNAKGNAFTSQTVKKLLTIMHQELEKGKAYVDKAKDYEIAIDQKNKKQLKILLKEDYENASKIEDKDLILFAKHYLREQIFHFHKSYDKMKVIHKKIIEN